MEKRKIAGGTRQATGRDGYGMGSVNSVFTRVMSPKLSVVAMASDFPASSSWRLSACRRLLSPLFVHSICTDVQSKVCQALRLAGHLTLLNMQKNIVSHGMPQIGFIGEKLMLLAPTHPTHTHTRRSGEVAFHLPPAIY